MAFSFDHTIFKKKEVREFLDVIEPVAHKGHLGLKRWDMFVDYYPHSGIVSLPMKVGYNEFKIPFYFYVEKVFEEEALFIKPVEGEPYRVGLVWNFFGLHNFGSYRMGWPVIIVEGTSDWRALIEHYPYVLASMTAKISLKQLYFLYGLGADVYVGFDLDDAGTQGFKKYSDRCVKLGMTPRTLTCPAGDWGKMLENGFQKKLLKQLMESWKEKQKFIRN